MRLLVHRSIVVLIALGALQACGVGWDGIQAKTKLRQDVPHEPGTGLVVTTRNGSVEIVESTQPTVSVEANLRARGATQAEADERAAAATLRIQRPSGGDLTIEPAFPGGWRNGDAASLVVRLPDATRIEIDTSNGGVTVNSFAGPLVIETSNGPVKVDDHAGHIRIETANGRIVATNIGGSARCNTSNGSITVELRHDQPGPIDARTSNGSIRATVGPAFTGTVAARTTNGRVHIDDHAGVARRTVLSRNHAEIELAGRGPASSLRTSNGSITIAIGE